MPQPYHTIKITCFIYLMVTLIAACHAQNHRLAKPDTASKNLPKMVKINKAINFITNIQLGHIYLEEVVAEVNNEHWTSFKMVLKTDVETHQILEQETFFNNKVENRLDQVEGGFNADLPVFMELELDTDNFHLLPKTGTNLAHYFDDLSAEAGLLQENSWNLLTAWQAHQLDPSIGGGVLKVGYQTVFTQPQNKVDALKRRGIVSKAIVTALIESQFPVHFNEEVQGFETKLMLENEIYTAFIKPNDADIAIEINILTDNPINDPADTAVLELIEKANQEITVGEFALNNNNQLHYFHYMKVSEEMVHPKWVTEMLLAGLSLMHHYHPVD